MAFRFSEQAGEDKSVHTAAAAQGSRGDFESTYRRTAELPSPLQTSMALMAGRATGEMRARRQPGGAAPPLPSLGLQVKLPNLLLAALKLTLESGNTAGRTQVHCYGVEEQSQDASIITQNNLAD